MPTYGANAAGSGATDGGAGVAWTDPNNITASDDSKATVDLSIDAATEYLQARGFGFSVTGTDTVVGVQFDIECQDGVGSADLASVSSVKLVKAGTQAGTDQSDSAFLPSGGDRVLTYGGATNMWGTTITPTDVNSATFGVDFSIGGSGFLGAPASVDYISCTVYTTAGGVVTAKVMPTLAFLGVG